MKTYAHQNNIYNVASTSHFYFAKIMTNDFRHVYKTERD